MALAILHDTPIRSETDKDNLILSAIWRIRKAFGCKQSEFVGYWKSARFVTVGPRDCYVRLWRHPENGVLAAASTLTRDTANVRIGFNMEGLGLPGRVSVRDVRADKALRMDRNSVSLILESQDWTLIWIRPDA